MRKSILATVLLVISSLAAAKTKVGCIIVYNANYPVHGRNPVSDYLSTLKAHVSLLKKLGLKGDYWFTWLSCDRVLGSDPSILKTLRSYGFGIHHHGGTGPLNRAPLGDAGERTSGPM